MTLANLKKEIGGKSPIFECAIGWLTREDKLLLLRDKQTYRVYLKEEHGQRATAA